MLKKLTKNFIILFCSLFALSVSAKQGDYYPKGCSTKSVEYHYDNVTLATKPSDKTYRVFVFRNISNQAIQMDQAQEQNSLGAHYISTIAPHSWSAFLVENSNIKMICQDLSGYGAHQVSCKNVIKACELRVAPVMASAQGQYWITENQSSVTSLFSELRSHGIFP